MEELEEIIFVDTRPVKVVVEEEEVCDIECDSCGS